VSLRGAIGRWIPVVGALARDDKPSEDGPEEAKPEPTPSDTPYFPGDAGLGAAVVRIRATCKWIVVSATAVAALVLGTAPLGEFGELEGNRLALAILGVALGLAGVLVVTRSGASVEEPVGLSARELVLAEQELLGEDVSWPRALEPDHQQIKDAVAWIRDAELVEIHEPEPADGALRQPEIAYVNNQRDAARDAWQCAQRYIDGATSEEERKRRAEERKGPEATFRRLETELGRLIDLANFRRLRSRYATARTAIGWASAVGAVGILLFAWAVNPPEEPPPEPVDLAGTVLSRAAGVDLAGATLAGALLQGADLQGTNLTKSDLTAAQLQGAKLAGAKLEGANLTAANLRGAEGLTVEAVEDVTWLGAICPNGDRLSGAGQSCATRRRLGS